MRYRLLILLFTVAFSSVGVVASEPNLIPTPRSYVAMEGRFMLSAECGISVECAELQDAAEYLAAHLGV